MLRRHSLIVALSLTVACSGCASFGAGQLPRLSRSEFTAAERLPAVSYTCTAPFDSATFGNSPGWPTPAVEQLFRGAFVDARSGPAADDLHLDIVFQGESRQPIFTLTLATLTVCSLGLIPAYGRDDLTLAVRVEYQGKLAREYVYTDRVETWIHLVMIPWAFSNDPVEVQRSVFENMLLHFMRDLRKDLPTLVPAG